MNPDHLQPIFKKAADRGLAGCRTCGLMSSIREHPKCPRCHSKLYTRKPNSIENTLALVVAALLLFIPSHLLPMITVTEFGLAIDKTIIAGMTAFWLERLLW